MKLKTVRNSAISIALLGLFFIPTVQADHLRSDAAELVREASEARNLARSELRYRERDRAKYEAFRDLQDLVRAAEDFYAVIEAGRPARSAYREFDNVKFAFKQARASVRLAYFSIWVDRAMDRVTARISDIARWYDDDRGPRPGPGPRPDPVREITRDFGTLCIGGSKCWETRLPSEREFYVNLGSQALVKQITFTAHDNVGRNKNASINVYVDNMLVASNVDVSNYGALYTYRPMMRGSSIRISTNGDDEAVIQNLQVTYLDR